MIIVFIVDATITCWPPDMETLSAFLVFCEDKTQPSPPPPLPPLPPATTTTHPHPTPTPTPKTLCVCVWRVCVRACVQYEITIST